MALEESEGALGYTSKLLRRSLKGFRGAQTERGSSLPGQADGPEAKGQTGCTHTQGRIGLNQKERFMIFSHNSTKCCKRRKANRETKTQCCCKAFIEGRKKQKTTTTVDYMPLSKIKNRSDALL